MYEIKYINGDVLYVAKNTKDVRATLTEAVSNGANLTGAYLGGADLTGADLTGADLTGADLYGANLGGANLTRAYLTRAHLGGADLTGADLTGADLTGANLTGANLGGNIWKEVATKLEASLRAMNDNGRHWIKGELSRKIEDGSLAYCSIGSVKANSDGTVRTVALWLLNSVCAGPIENFNDHPDTTWEDVQAVFAVAISHARRLAAS